MRVICFFNLILSTSFAFLDVCLLLPPRNVQYKAPRSTLHVFQCIIDMINFNTRAWLEENKKTQTPPQRTTSPPQLENTPQRLFTVPPLAAPRLLARHTRTAIPTPAPPITRRI